MRNINEIKNLVLRKFKGSIYYFNDNGIYCEVKSKEAEKMNFSNLHFRKDGTFWIDDTFFTDYINPNWVIARKAIAKLELGSTIEDFKKIIENTKLDVHIKPDGLERFITKINKPTFVRCPENLKENTFDYIYVDLCIISKWDEDKKQYIKKHIKQIEEKVLSTLESNKTFKSFGVPLNYLKVSRITIKRDNVLQFVLEIKSI